MLTIFGRKKISTEKVGNMFVRTICETVEQGYPDVAGFINDSPEFVRSPNISPEDYGRFLMIVIAGNFAYMPPFFQHNEEEDIIYQCKVHCAPVYGMSLTEFGDKVKEYKDFMSKINSPSKNTLYAMSKAVFFKYGLNNYQEEYFKVMNTPNPIFLKNLDEIMRNFLWDWEAFNEKYKIVTEQVL
ncbi:MAG: hypothetical protein OEW26_06170 [Nitrospirota bacterium]|nr:hypothetical protein [Nitrospirota bacterium]